MRWQPQLGLLALSSRMVRFVKSGSRLPRGPPRGCSMSPAGPCCWNFFFQEYRVCLDTPTKAAKSPAGRPLRSQVSSRSKRCSALSDSGLAVGFTKRRPRRRPDGGRGQSLPPANVAPEDMIAKRSDGIAPAEGATSLAALASWAFTTSSCRF